MYRFADFPDSGRIPPLQYLFFNVPQDLFLLGRDLTGAHLNPSMRECFKTVLFL